MSSSALHTKQIIQVAALAAIVGGAIVIARLPAKRMVETLDMQRVTSANTLEAAIEQYALHKARRRGTLVPTPSVSEP